MHFVYVARKNPDSCNKSSNSYDTFISSCVYQLYTCLSMDLNKDMMVISCSDMCYSHIPPLMSSSDHRF